MIDQKVARIVERLKKYLQTIHVSKAVVGLSGGVDSALVVKLGVMAVGKENVTALILPNDGLTDPQNVKDAENWAKELGISYQTISINPFLGAYRELPWETSEIASLNVQARARATILYHFANTHNALVLGTGNKTEETLGYFTKYGDGAVDVLPIASLYKTEVWEAAKFLGLPKEIIEKTPSAELKAGQTDEGEIGLSYAEMDAILQKFEKGEKPKTKIERELWGRVQANRHKSQMPPVL